MRELRRVRGNELDIPIIKSEFLVEDVPSVAREELNISVTDKLHGNTGPAKKRSQELSLKAADKKWAKIEAKTGKLIEKSEKKPVKLYRTSLELGSYMDRITHAKDALFYQNPTRIDYLYLMGNPLIVTNYIISNLNQDGFIDSSTNEIAEDLGLHEHTVKNVISKLSRRGFLNCKSNPGSKRRIVIVNPSILSL